MKKKILKIIQIVYDILSLGFIIFVVCAMSITPKREAHSNNDVSEVVEIKRKENYAINGGYYAITPYELFTTNYFYEKAFANTSFATTTNIGTSYSMFDIITNTRVVTWYDVNYSNSDLGYSNGTDVSYIRFTLDTAGSQNFTRYQNWTLAISMSGGVTLTYTIEIMYNNLSSNNSMISVDLIKFDSVGVVPTQSLFLVSSNETLIGYINGGSYDEGYKRGYDYGYDKGYDVGYDEGYEEGKERQKEIDRDPASETYQYIYDLGKQEGIVEGMRGTESNAFIVIGQAFGAVGSILSIEVMPNLPLWVLVFTPLIIVVVIVVVKLIKG